MNYYHRWPGHYINRTLHLTMEQDGAYSRLLDYCYLNDCFVPHAERYLVARASRKSEKNAVDFVLKQFFVRDGNEWGKTRISDELSAGQKRIETAKANGSKGGRPKKLKQPHNPAGSLDETQRVSHSKPTDKARQSPIKSPLTDTSLEGTRDARPHEGLEGTFEGQNPALSDKPPAPLSPVVRLAVVLNNAGVRCTSMNPDLVAYAQEGGTPEHLLDIASLPECADKPVTYIARFARRELKQKAAPVIIGQARNGGPSKTMDGIMALEEMKRELTSRDVAPTGNPERIAEAPVPESRKISSQ